MRSLIILVISLFGTFLGIWAYKVKTPVPRPDEYAQGYDVEAGAWWNASYTNITRDEGWTLADMDVPENYKPVPGQSNLFMVVDNNGRITGYMKRTRQIDGSWKWEEVNPDIPEDYEAVDGLEDVYRVTDEDGSVHYYKYIRNEDDTFAFVECDENGNFLDIDRDATTVDLKHHISITGNIYSLLNDHGVVIGYQRRVDNGDGTFTWEDLPDFDDMANKLKESNTGAGTDDHDLQDLYKRLLEEQDQNMDPAEVTVPDVPEATVSGDTGSTTINITGNTGTAGGTVSATPGTATVINNADGSTTKVQIVRETKTGEDGRKTTYESRVTQTFNADGTLRESNTEGPFEVSSVETITDNVTSKPDPDAVVSDLGGEVARYTNSVVYDETTASQVFTQLNAQRAQNHLSALTLSDAAVCIAKLRAADMMNYDTTDMDLPTYGTLSNMLEKFRISSSLPGENAWKTLPKTAADIHTRLQTTDSSRKTRMNSGVTSYGCAIAYDSRQEHIYFVEVFL